MIVVLLLAGIPWFFNDPGDEGLVGISGQSFILDDQYVIVRNGYSLGKVTYVVVRNWPVSSSPEGRLEDDRFLTRGVNKPQIKLPDGSYKPVENVPHLYFFDGDHLTEFPIAMQEDDFIDFHPEKMTGYGNVLEFFESYEAGQ
jgi:hypothetical protein